jgi:hypothetical protein
MYFDHISISLQIATGVAQSCGFLKYITPLIHYSSGNFSGSQEYTCAECDNTVLYHKNSMSDIDHLRSHHPDGDVRILRCTNVECNMIMNALKEDDLEHIEECS